MTGRERLMATLRGEQVDRPAVNFYEIGGFQIEPQDPNPFNVYNDPSWKPLLQLAEEHTDLIRMCNPFCIPSVMRQEFFREEEYMKDGSLFYRTTIKAAERELTSLTRRDPDIDTVWTLEHLLKDTDDLQSYLQLPDEVLISKPDLHGLYKAEKAVGDSGIVMVDVPDPIGLAAGLFSMENYMVIALTEQKLFHALLEKHARILYSYAERVSKEFSGRLWRIVGSEYAAEPYLPPRLFGEYVVKYTEPLVQIVKKYGGYARIHSHGRLRGIMPYLAEMGIDALDPLEPPPQGDMELCEIRREYGQSMVLFGNLEISDIETMDPIAFEKVVERSLLEGTSGSGRGFVLMPSASPYGRKISLRTMTNYETIVRLAQQAAF